MVLQTSLGGEGKEARPLALREGEGLAAWLACVVGVSSKSPHSERYSYNRLRNRVCGRVCHLTGHSAGTVGEPFVGGSVYVPPATISFNSVVCYVFEGFACGPVSTRRCFVFVGAFAGG